jgi:hypothetical protein
MATKTILTIVLLISPILLIQLGMAIYALRDLYHRKIVHGPRWAWAVLLVLSGVAVPTGILVSILYFVWGRQPGMEAADDSD